VRDNDLCITILPRASTPCTLSVDFARSIPMVVIFVVDSFARLERLAPSNMALHVPLRGEGGHIIRWSS